MCYCFCIKKQKYFAKKSECHKNHIIIICDFLRFSAWDLKVIGEQGCLKEHSLKSILHILQAKIILLLILLCNLSQN